MTLFRNFRSANSCPAADSEQFAVAEASPVGGGGALRLSDSRQPRPRYAWHFAATTALTILMLCSMTVYYGFRELEHTASDITTVLAGSVQSQRALGWSGTDLIQRELAHFHDVKQIEICVAGRCDVHSADDAAPMNADLLQLVGWPCANRALPHGEAGDKVTVCMKIDDVTEDISRDVVILLLAQGIGFGIWLGASRRFAARRKVWNERVQRAATTDAATGLLNRAAFTGQLDALLRSDEQGWLVLVGIDQLKSVNEFHGAAVGDQVILAVAERLGSMEDHRLALGRTGGDEFALVMRGASPVALERTLSRLRTLMSAPIAHDAMQLAATVSAGAVALEPQVRAPELMRRATVALRAAKKVGTDSQSIFSVAFDIELRKQHQLRLDLLSAIDKDQVELVYQPIVDGNGQIVLMEALARWRHPEMGAVSPDVFIGVAESSGLIHPLGIALLRKACEALVQARARGLPLQRMAVNLSPLQLTHPDLPDIVLAVVHAAGLQPTDIELELTESAAMASRQDATQPLRSLADVGFSIAIDDFGTGYSSLSRLQTLPIRKLKIDRSFIQNCDEPSGAVLLEAMIDLARRLGLTCVAEGVETEAQRAWLQARGCDLFQGYLFARPAPIDHFIGPSWRASAGVSAPGLVRAMPRAANER